MNSKQPTVTGSASSKDPVTKNGVLIPADNSFEAINRFVNHVPSPEYEELQWAMLGLATAHEKAAKDLKACILALDGIAADYEHMKRKDMIERAGVALCDVGAWRKVMPGEFARHGRVLATSTGNPANQSVMGNPITESVSTCDGCGGPMPVAHTDERGAEHYCAKCAGVETPNSD